MLHRTGGGGRSVPAALALTFLFVALALTALAAAARAETGAPALEGDGVWRARGDWTVQAGDIVVHEGVSIEVMGNLTIEANGSLALRNASLRFTNGSAPSHLLEVGAGAALNLSNATLAMEGPLDRIEVLGGSLSASDSTLALTSANGTSPAIRAQSGALTFLRCQVTADAGPAVSAQGSDLAATSSDFLRRDGGPADLFLGGSGSHVLDTTGFGALRTDGAASVSAYATVRFLLVNATGAPLAGRVNGTGPYGEFFAFDTGPGAEAPLRVKWFDLAPAPQLLLPADQRSPAPLRFEAVVGGLGGNTSAAPITGPRQNITVTIDQVYDLAVVSFTVSPGTLGGSTLKAAYYVELNKTVDLLFEVQNRGAGTSEATSLRVVALALEPSSWAVQGSRDVREVPVRALSPGESVNISFEYVAGPYGGMLNSSTGCLHDLSYTFALDASVGQGAAGDFAPWNNERTVTVVSFETWTEPTPECQPKGQSFLPYAAGAAAASVAAVGYITYRFSDRQAARRAARRAREGAPGGTPEDEAGNAQPQTPPPPP